MRHGIVLSRHACACSLKPASVNLPHFGDDTVQYEYNPNAVCMCPLFCVSPEKLYDCPVTGKVFTEHTHIVAVKPTGNVYSYEAVSRRAGAKL